ncbi:MAG TPA: site-2 protease family protein [Thermomicrobiaceae bacterium]|nr:site-2 protease family protein [Thermomicrobiaceae bacterium]
MPGMGGGISLGKIFGIEIRIDWSWLLIFLLITWNVYVVLPQLNNTWSRGFTLILAIIASILFFLSVLAHELAHSLMAKARGINVSSITLFLFGGVSNITREPPTPGVEFAIAIVGPLTSIVLGIIFIVLANVSYAAVAHPLRDLHQIGPATAIFLWLGPVNLILGVFNLVPGFPLDGGRVLRSALWAATDNLKKATRWASWVGDAIGWLFIVMGVYMVFGGSIPFFGTGLIGGLWIAFIGWFLHNAAQASYQQVVITDILKGVPVTRIMRTNVPTVPEDAHVGQLVDLMMHSDEHSFPVMRGDELVGLIALDDVRRVPRDEWETTPVRQIMTPVDKLAVASPREDANDVFTELATKDVNQLPVVQDGKLVGMVRRGDLMRFLQLHQEGARA